MLGGGGMLGHRFCRELAAAHEVWTTSRGTPVAELAAIVPRERIVAGVDLGRRAAVDGLLARLRPEAVVNAAGIVKQSAEIADRARVRALNAELPRVLARRAGELGHRLIHVSTDCVFSGRRGGYQESDPPDPVDFYGESKAAGEVVGPRCLTLRTSAVGREIGGRRQGLLEWLLARPPGSRVPGFRRALFSGPTTGELARRVAALLVAPVELEGLFHVAAPPISKFDLLRGLRDALGLDLEIEPVEEPAIDRSLDGRRFRAATGWTPPPWREMIAGMIDEIDARSGAGRDVR